jgi:hypothetical protein
MGFVLFAAGITAGMSGCDEVDAAFDCQAVCSRYKDCFDSNYNVGQCRDKCRANADADDNKRRQADICEACIDDRSCTAATFNCSTECAGIIALR